AVQLFWRILRKVFSSVFLATVTVVGAPAAFAVTVFAALIILPLPATLPIPKANPISEPSVIYDRNGNVIATLQQFDKNIPVPESAIPQVLKEAVVSDEDKGFYHHGGVDFRGTLRAIVNDVRGKPLQGGSTITQQYVKLAYTGGQRNLARKIREAILASQLDRQASKDEILYRYLLIIYLGDGNTGVGAASENYFHIPVNQLDASQAATLAGLIPAPSARAPRENLAAAETSRELVLGEMRQQGYLTGAQYTRAMAEKLALAGTKPLPPANATLIYPPTTAAPKYPDFVSYVTQWLLAHYPPSVVYGGGLRIQTTLDPSVQNAAEASVHSTLAGTRDPLEMALAAVEPQTGFVEAVVGGRAFGQTGAQFSDDNFALGGCDPKPKGAVIQVAATCWGSQTVTGGGSGRQPGSAWKPFVLATAFEQGTQPGRVYSAPGVYTIPGCRPGSGPDQGCTIHNDEPGSQLGTETLAQATVQSTNTVYAQVAPQVGCANVAKTAKALGIESAYYSSATIPYCSTYALGVIDVSPLDMASAYGVFDNHGRRAAPTPILEIVNASGKVLVNNIGHAPSTTQVVPANVADNVTNVLQGVLTHGTGTQAALGRPAAGKTGTTSNYTNAWFVGYTPTLSTAVWMGNAQSQGVSLGDVKGVEPVYGGTWPARTWRAFMTQALQGVPATPFSQPAPIVPPAVAKALQSPSTTTQPTVVPGNSGFISGTPTGGPYTESPSQVPPPPAPLPAVTTPPPASTVPPASTPSTTTAPSSTTTTSTSVP
ncbi:MAG: penicillin-binding protein, partial [Acidimicrobiaceae bacterium]|nr:penicillin-binding protein [Acidimicrobiaceae bacterium]